MESVFEDDCICFVNIEGRRITNKWCPAHGNRSMDGPVEARIPKKQLTVRMERAFWAGIKDAFLLISPWCVECGREGTKQTLDLDHIIPKSQGGQSVASNARLLCNRFMEFGKPGCHDLRHGVPFGEEEAQASDGQEVQT